MMVIVCEMIHISRNGLKMMFVMRHIGPTIRWTKNDTNWLRIDTNWVQDDIGCAQNKTRWLRNVFFSIIPSMKHLIYNSLIRASIKT